MALHVLAYNLTRVMNIMGIQPLMAAMGACSRRSLTSEHRGTQHTVVSNGMRRMNGRVRGEAKVTKKSPSSTPYSATAGG
jgi:hypothetical protein